MSLSTTNSPPSPVPTRRPGTVTHDSPTGMIGHRSVASVRQDFPILARQVHGKPLVYLDNAASAQKPQAVIDRLNLFYRDEYANIHRGIHTLSQVATKAFEDARGTVARFIGAERDSEIVFTRGTTEGINLVAQTWGRRHLGPGDEIVITAMEHHANIVPWQLLCDERGCVLRVIPVTDDGELDVEAGLALLSDRTKLLSMVWVSNSLGTVNPIDRLIPAAKERGATVLLDAAQAVTHQRVDVGRLGCDFLVFSGHKLYGPTGIGVLWGRYEVLDTMPPYQGGGDMIERVTFARSSFAPPPSRFEAGTPHIAGAVGLAAAIDYVDTLGMEAIAEYEHSLLREATERLSRVPGLRIIGTARDKVAVVSFTMEGIHPFDIGTVLDQDGVAVRTGHHCTQPLMERFGVTATTRASFSFYNTLDEVQALERSLEKVRKFLA